MEIIYLQIWRALKENGKRIVEGGKYALSPSRCDGKLRGGRKI